MSDQNPYESPPATSTREPEPQPLNESAAPEDDGKIIRFAQLGLRLLGVFFFVEGLVGVVFTIAYGAWQSSMFRQAGYEPFFDAYGIGWFAMSFAHLAAGFYFVTDGRWVLEKVFLPGRIRHDVDHCEHQ